MLKAHKNWDFMVQESDGAMSIESGLYHIN